MSINARVSKDAASVARAAAENILALALDRVEMMGRFSIALSGGSTPKAAYALLAAEPFARKMPWEKTRIYFGDERLVPHDHADSNYRMAHEALLKHVSIPPGNVVAIPTENDDPQLCAEYYEDILKLQFQRRSDQFPSLDLVLLGVGPDGHTASLFPGTPALDEMQHWVTWCDPVAANPQIKPAVKRITITKPVIWHAANVLVLATGAEKRHVMQDVFAENDPANPPPARLLRQCRGQVTILMDQPAAP